MSSSKGKEPRGAPGSRRFLAALVVLLCASQAQALPTSALLDTLQHTAFNYFWNQANPANGLIKDRSTSGSPCSIAALGFGLSAICIGIDHGWVTRDTGRARILTALNTLWTQPQGPATGDGNTIGYKGLYYHFLDMTTGRRTWLSELSTIDTALLFAGVLDTKQYFSTPDAGDVQVRALVDSIYGRADWEFMRNLGPGIRMGWKPEGGFCPPPPIGCYGTWIGYNEAMILYILALGSPTHPVPASTWNTWTSGYSYQTLYGQTYVVFAPLFGHQYSHCWVDFHNIRDAYMTGKGITYFENSRRATLAARAYCIANPSHFVGYGANVWGLTASDDPQVGYQAHGAPPPQNDNGTITPTAAASSIAFAPEVVIPALHNMYDTYPLLWSTYGFKDAFNLTLNWYDTDYLGIDQGPIILMIENFRNRGVWKRMMSNAAIQLGLQRAGFQVATDVASGDPEIERCVLFQSVPNPARGPAFIPFSLPRAGRVSLSLYDVSGRRVLDLTDGSWTAGRHEVPLQAERLPSGVYYYRLEYDDQRVQRRLTVIR